MNNDQNLPVDMIIVEPTVIEGKHVEVGKVIKNCETPLAMDLAGSGKARPATPELIEEYKKRKENQAKAEKAAADAALKAAAEKSNANSEALAKVISDAIASGVAQAVAAATPAPAPEGAPA